MAKINDELKAKIRADRSCGLSFTQLQDKYELSRSRLCEICKGVEPINAEIIEQKTNAEIAYLTALSEKSEQEANAITEQVKERLKAWEFFANSAFRNQKKANEILEMTDKMAEVESHARLTAKNKETVLGREANTQISVNNTQNNVFVVERKIIQ